MKISGSTFIICSLIWLGVALYVGREPDADDAQTAGIIDDGQDAGQVSGCRMTAKSYANPDGMPLDAATTVVVETANATYAVKCAGIFVEIDEPHARIIFDAATNSVTHQSPFTSGGWEGQAPLKPVNTTLLRPDGALLHEHMPVENYPDGSIRRAISPDDGSARILSPAEARDVLKAFDANPQGVSK